MDMEIVPLASRPGYYRSDEGAWLNDRRIIPDRRTFPTVSESRFAGRRTIRRLADREALQYIIDVADAI